MSWASARRVEIIRVEHKETPKPAQWESFPFLERYYGGVRSLILRKENVAEYPGDGEAISKSGENATETIAARDLQGPSMKSTSFNPYPDYASTEYRTTHGAKVDCTLDVEGKVKIPSTQSFLGIPRGMPDPVMGSNDLFGMQDVCFDRFGRLGPYGIGYSLKRGGTGASLNGDREGVDEVWREVEEVDYRKVDWAEAQDRCVKANSGRFKELPSSRLDTFRAMQVGSTAPPDKKTEKKPTEDGEDAGKLPRTAVVIRTWSDFEYTPEAIVYLRTLISELSIQSGGEYVVQFLIHVKDNDLPIWSDDETYERVLQDSLPEEFQGMGILWSERQMSLMYTGLEETWMRDLPVGGVYRSTYFPMQYFALQHPEYDYIWHWEMDIRYTGHYYHLFDSVAKWAKQQPRKGLWERNSRFYVPSEHGSWEDFRQMVRVQTEQGTNSANNIWSGLNAASGSSNRPAGAAKQQGDKPIWGPEVPPNSDIKMPTIDVEPPTTYEKDKYTWGVGEDADLITFNPLFDPHGTTWLLANDVTGYDRSEGVPLPPRRTAIITASRLSRKLLMTMHRETTLKRHTMFSEMWPGSCALHHGLKAVYAPHAEYIDRRWPTKYLESVFNGGRNGATGGARTSVFGDREHNFRGTTWYYNAGFPEVLWHRWLGYKFNNDGGEEWELANEGRMCLPPMLLHPIKQVRLVTEGKKAG
ncbi:MAG: hypothetical protein Q9227_006452 [Pyrenula ochraceoflavens]